MLITNFFNKSGRLKVSQESINGFVHGFVLGEIIALPVLDKSAAQLQAFPVTDLLGFGSIMEPGGVWGKYSDIFVRSLFSVSEKTGSFEILFTKYNTPENDNYLFDVIQFGSDDARFVTLFSHLLYIKGVDKVKLNMLSNVDFVDDQIYNDLIFMLLFSDFLMDYKNPEKALVKTISQLKKLKPEFRLCKADKIVEKMKLDFFDAQILPTYFFNLLSFNSLVPVWSLITSSSYRQTVLKAVNCGRNLPLSCAISGALAGLFYNYNSLPNEWLHFLNKKNDIISVCNKVFYTVN